MSNAIKLIFCKEPMSANGTELPVRLGLALCRSCARLKSELIQIISIFLKHLKALFQAIQSFFEVMALLLNIFQRF
ncbi:Uncharacterised protein [Yersinia enterocolitica]|nr:Uncharacterised protein [Yersinia enterocolitica]